MFRRSLILTMAILVTVGSIPQTAQAWVVIRVLPKGHVPSHRFANSITSLMKDVPPIYGDVIDGFSHYTCRLYYRGTQNDVQVMLDGLAKIDDVTLVVNIDRSGTVGILPAGKRTSLKRPVPYLYQVSLYQNDLLKNKDDAWEFDDNGKFLPPNRRTTVTLTVHSAGGLKPDQLNIPKPVSVAKHSGSALSELKPTDFQGRTAPAKIRDPNSELLVVGDRELPIRPLPQTPDDDSGANH